MDSSQKQSTKLLSQKGICNLSGTLVCVAIVCIAVIVVVASLKHLGVWQLGQKVYNKTGRLIGSGYNRVRNTVRRQPVQLKKEKYDNERPGVERHGNEIHDENYENENYYGEGYEQEGYNQEDYNQEGYEQGEYYNDMENYRQSGQDENYEGFDDTYYEGFEDQNNYEQYEGFDEAEYANELSVDEKKRLNELGTDVTAIKKDIEDIKKKCPGTLVQEKKESYYQEDFGQQENFGNPQHYGSKEFSPAICNGTSQLENIQSSADTFLMDYSARCVDQDGVYDEIIGDMNPYYLNEIAAGGQGNDLIATMSRTVKQPMTQQQMMQQQMQHQQHQQHKQQQQQQQQKKQQEKFDEQFTDVYNGHEERFWNYNENNE